MARRLASLVACFAQFVVNLSAAQQHAVDVALGACVGQHALVTAAGAILQGRTTRGCRSRLLGVITTSGLRQGRSTWRRST